MRRGVRSSSLPTSFTRWGAVSCPLLRNLGPTARLERAATKVEVLILQFDAHVCNMSIRFIFANSEIQIRKLPFSCMVLGSVPARVVVDVFCLLLHSKKIY